MSEVPLYLCADIKALCKVALRRSDFTERRRHRMVIRVLFAWGEDSYFTEMCSGSEEGSYLRLIDFCITQL